MFCVCFELSNDIIIRVYCAGLNKNLSHSPNFIDTTNTHKNTQTHTNKHTQTNTNKHTQTHFTYRITSVRIVTNILKHNEVASLLSQIMKFNYRSFTSLCISHNQTEKSS
jgi:hypothetical protein